MLFCRPRQDHVERLRKDCPSINVANMMSEVKKRRMKPTSMGKFECNFTLSLHQQSTTQDNRERIKETESTVNIYSAFALLLLPLGPLFQKTRPEPENNWWRNPEWFNPVRACQQKNRTSKGRGIPKQHPSGPRTTFQLGELHYFLVAFCSPAKSLIFGGLMENPFVGKKLKSSHPSKTKTKAFRNEPPKHFRLRHEGPVLGAVASNSIRTNLCHLPTGPAGTGGAYLPRLLAALMPKVLLLVA